MKKIFKLFLVALVAMILFACGGNKMNDENEGTNNNVLVETKSKIVGTWTPEGNTNPQYYYVFNEDGTLWDQPDTKWVYNEDTCEIVYTKRSYDWEETGIYQTWTATYWKDDDKIFMTNQFYTRVEE